MSRVLHWTGVDLREDLADLPHGRYVLVPVEDLADLTDDEEEGLEQALDALKRGEGIPLEESRERLRAKLR